MVVSYLFEVFLTGSIGIKISMIIFILVIGILLTWAIFALVGLEELRQNRGELFQIITNEELKEFNILADYKVFDRGEDVYFTEKGIIVRDAINLRMILYSDILVEEMMKDISKYLHMSKLPSKISIPLITPKKIKLIFGGQSLRIFLPGDDSKKKIILENLNKILL